MDAMDVDKENSNSSMVRVPLKAVCNRGKGKCVFIDEDNFMYLKNRERPNGTIYLNCRSKRNNKDKVQFDCKVSAIIRKWDKDAIYVMKKYSHNHVSNGAKAD